MILFPYPPPPSLNLLLRVWELSMILFGNGMIHMMEKLKESLPNGHIAKQYGGTLNNIHLEGFGYFWLLGLHQWSCSSVQSFSCVWHFATPWTAAHQASLSITKSQSLPKPMSIESVMPSNHLIFCHPLLLPPSIFSSIRVFSNELVLHIQGPKY